MLQKGNILLISILLGGLLVGGLSIYFLLPQNDQIKKSVYQSNLDQAKETQILADFKTIQTALESYRLNNRRYPASLEELVKVSLLSKLPRNPYTNSEYEYQATEAIYTLSAQRGDGSIFEVTN